MSAASNARWIALTQLVKIGSQLANMFVLTRYVTPADYGLMAMAGVATNLALILRDMGTAAAIIQKKDLDDRDTSSVFWLNVLIGVLLAVGLFICAPLMASIFNESRLTDVLYCLALTFPIASTSAAHQALLERESQFQTIAGVESAASFLALVAALILAVLGAGVYSLVVQAFLMTAVATVLLWVKSPWRPTLNYDRNSVRSVFSFSGNMTGYQLTSYIFRNSDSLIIGNIFGAAVLGVYSVAYKVMLFPVQNISWVASRALFPVMSRLQSDKIGVQDLCLKALRFVSFVTAPMMFGLAGVSDVFVQTVFGEKWAAMSPLLAYLALVGYIQVVVGVTGPVFMAMGKTNLLFRLAIVNAFTHVSLFWWGATSGGIRGLAAGYLLASLVMALPTFYLCAHTLGVSMMSYLRTTAVPMIGGAAVFASVKLVLVVAPDLSRYVQLSAAIVVGAVVYLFYSLALQKPALRNFGKMAGKKL